MPPKGQGHGGPRKGAGRPATTASSAVPPVTFRLGAEDYDRAVRVAARQGIGVNAAAKAALLDRLDREAD
jgi:hypothetical protein